MRDPNICKFLARCVAFAKRWDVANTALRYNPLYYGRVARLLRDVDAMDRAQRKALADRLTERTLHWACAAGARMPPDAGLAEWPILEKDYVRDNAEAQRYPRVFAVPAATGEPPAYRFGCGARHEPSLPSRSSLIVRMQVIQEAVDDVRILVIPEPCFGDADREVLMANVRRKLPDDMTVTIELVDALKRLPSGKVPYVIRQFESNCRR